ncbi:MAG: hypothetical protein ACRCSG_00845 [Cellulosilyticaceae bacterium]
MKTLFIDASPKRKWSNSAYFLGYVCTFLGANKNDSLTIKLPRANKYNDVFEHIKNCDKVVLGVPVYVDGLPSHVLVFLKELEKFCHDNQLTFTLYTVSNCGFFEGTQTQHLLAQLKLWCDKSNIKWGGGVGIGAGEMLGFLRFLPIIFIIIAGVLGSVELVSQLINNTFSVTDIISSMGIPFLLIRIGISTIFSMGMMVKLFEMSRKLKKSETFDCVYTGLILCPKWLFMALASCYWFIRMLIMHKNMPWTAFRKENKISETK